MFFYLNVNVIVKFLHIKELDCLVPLCYFFVNFTYRCLKRLNMLFFLARLSILTEIDHCHGVHVGKNTAPSPLAQHGNSVDNGNMKETLLLCRCNASHVLPLIHFRMPICLYKHVATIPPKVLQCETAFEWLIIHTKVDCLQSAHAAWLTLADQSLVKSDEGNRVAEAVYLDFIPFVFRPLWF